MCVGLGSAIKKEDLRLANFIDADGNEHPLISEMPFMILKTNSNKIRTLRSTVIEKEIQFVDFIHTMTGATYVKQKSVQNKQQTMILFTLALFYLAIGMQCQSLPVNFLCGNKILEQNL